MSSDLKLMIPRLIRVEEFEAEARQIEEDEKSGIRDDTEGDEILDIYHPPELDILDPKAASRIVALQSSTEYLHYRAYLDEFTQYLSSLNLQHFKPQELLQMGGSHNTPGHHCYGKNSLPPKALWPNVKPLARALDEARTILAHPIHLHCVYRNPVYNACIGGVKRSQHKRFCAVDLHCQDGKGSKHWGEVFKQVRQEGLFKGGIGVYSSFVHVDTRGYNANWEKL